MPNQILQVDENMLETKLDRLVSEKVEQLLNAMLDAEADEITGACRRSYTLECKTNAARRALEGEPLARVVFLVKSVFRVSSLIFFGFRHEECRPVVCFTGCPSCRT